MADEDVMIEDEVEYDQVEYGQYNEPVWRRSYHQFSNQMWMIIKSLGWYVVGICIVLIYTWPIIKKRYNSWKKKKDEQEYDAKYHKNVDLGSKLLLGTQLARERQQERYLKERELALQKEQERLEKKRQEVRRLDEQRSSGSRLGNGDAGSSSSSKSSLRGEYNPLMGGSTSRYVPPKRSCCKKGGGCG